MLKAPFPYFGGKSRVADIVWQRFGDTPNYLEPFAGSSAMLLARPGWDPESGYSRTETINDADGFVANFWRAVQYDPEQVAHHADWPANENDLHARHAWLVQNHLDSLAGRLEGDPDWYDPKVAGWWCWGMACWIGGRFCSGVGPWRQVDIECDGGGQGISRQLVNLGNGGHGISRQRLHIGDGGHGVHRKLLHLGNGGQGIHRKRLHIGDGGHGVHRKLLHLGDGGQGVDSDIYDWMDLLSKRLRHVRVCCGNWDRICTISPATFCSPVGVFLDPPYSSAAGRAEDLYATDDLDVAHDARRWAIDHGADSRYRIALCGYDTEHELPPGWTSYKWSASGGYRGNENRHREIIHFSPHCLSPENEYSKVGLFDAT